MQRFEHKLPGKMFHAEGRRPGGRWTTLRARWIRSFPECVRCGRPGEEVHHIIPRATRPDLTFDLSNLETLCRECHRKAHE